MGDHEQVLRTGVLFKKGSGTGPFGRRNWKPRYFVLSPSKLQYYTFEDGELKGELDLRGCDENALEVMPADAMKTGSSASTIWRVAINTPSRRLLVAAGTEMEMNDWIDKLVLAFRIGAGLQPGPGDARASSYAPADARVVQGGGQGGITDFQNFAAARRSVAGGMNRHSIGSHTGSAHSGGAGDIARHSDVDALLLAQAEQLREQQQRQREEEEARRLAAESDATAQAAADEERRAREEAERAERERLEEAQRVERERVEEEERLERERAEQERAERERVEKEQRVERERLERRAQDEARKQAVQEKLLADELAMTQSIQKAEQQEALLELQRRQKREEHERRRVESAQRAVEAAALQAKQEAEAAALRAKQEEDLHERAKQLALANEDPLERQRREKREKREQERAEREQRAREQEQRAQAQSEFDDLEFRMTAQLQQAPVQFFDNDNESDSESDEDEAAANGSEPERSPPLTAQPASAGSPSAAPAPRSSLIGDVKLETMRKQQAEHQRRREQSLQQEKLKLEMEQARARLEAAALAQPQPPQPQDARTEVEVVRRPAKAPAPVVMDSVEF